jgi:ribosomal protein S18 acetylase RimI-like enzyme
VQRGRNRRLGQKPWHDSGSTMSITHVDIELARLGDAEEIAAMSRAYIEAGLPWRWTPSRVAASIRDARTNVAVVRKGGRVVGFGIMVYREDDAHLLLLAVRRPHRRAGVATALLNWLELVAQVAGSTRIVVEARRDNDAARCLYAEQGYHELTIQRAMYSGLADGVHLEKWLRR